MGVGKDQGHMVVVTLGFIAAYTVVSVGFVEVPAWLD